MLLATFFVLRSAIRKEIFRKQYGGIASGITFELSICLRWDVPYILVVKKYSWFLVYGKNVISTNCICCELEYSWVSTRSSRSLIQIHRIFIRRNFYANVVKCQENKKLVTAIGVVAWAIGLLSSTCSRKQMSVTVASLK
jgi:hypothetical protein